MGSWALLSLISYSETGKILYCKQTRHMVGCHCQSYIY